jgi:hypothetical protein
VTSVEFASKATQAPPNPSKYDIIPIHSSDRQTFKSCRRKWVWSSPSKLNLIPRPSVYGVQKNFWFGTGIHYALERYYNPVIREDPWVAWESWFDLQWYGGIVSESELKQFADRNPREAKKQPEPLTQSDADGNIVWEGYPPRMYHVDGLSDLLPDPLADEWFLPVRDLGSGMMHYYKDYAEAHDDFTVILVEHDFSVPVLNSKGEPLYMVDSRLMPDGWEPDFDKGNEFGPLMRENHVITTRLGTGHFEIEKQVHVRGRMDMIKQEHKHGRYGITDHKSAATISEDYFRHLELDEQCTSYLSFGELEARIYDLEYKNLEFITYEAILKGYPKPPTPLKNGLPSINRAEETTTAELFAEYIKSNGLEPIFHADSKLQSYYTYLLEQGDKRFVQRQDTWRNQMQRKNAMIRVHAEAMDMLDPNLKAYPNPRKEYDCLNCVFRVPCIQAESGDDYMSTLENGYTGNWDR